MTNGRLYRVFRLLAVGLLLAGMIVPCADGAVIPITEDFDDGVLDPALEDVSGNYDLSAGVAEYVGPAESRNYIRTEDSDYDSANFHFEASITIPAVGDPWANGFFGIGSGAPGSYFDSPQPAYFLQLEARNQDTQLRRFDRDGTRHQLLEWSDLGPLGAGTHRVSMTKEGDDVTWAIDKDFSGTFAPDATRVRSFAGDTGMMTNADWRLFFGTGRDSYTSTFDDVAITPEPSALVLMILAGLGGVLGRRKLRED